MEKSKRIIAAITVLPILCAVFTACQSSDIRPEDQIINFIIESDPLTLDPQIADDRSSAILIANIFEGLVKSSDDGTISPGIAESWDISNDGLEYTFHLVENSCWSNGEQLTADDFIFGITRSLSPETRADNVSDLFPIKNAVPLYKGEDVELGVYAPDDHTLKIELEYPTDGILYALSENIAMPCSEEFFYSTKGKYGKDADLIITNGPFAIREAYGWEHDKYIYICIGRRYRERSDGSVRNIRFRSRQSFRKRSYRYRHVQHIMGNMLQHRRSRFPKYKSAHIHARNAEQKYCTLGRSVIICAHDSAYRKRSDVCRNKLS